MAPPDDPPAGCYRCEDCKWWSRDPEHPGTGECHCRPVLNVLTRHRGRTNATDWCHESAPATPTP